MVLKSWFGTTVSSAVEGELYLPDDFSRSKSAAYDLDMLYVECRLCGKPVIWEQGRTKALVQASGINSSYLDERCLILSDGCPACQPDDYSFDLHVVRLALFTPQDLLLLGEPKGNA